MFTEPTFLVFSMNKMRSREAVSPLKTFGAAGFRFKNGAPGFLAPLVPQLSVRPVGYLLDCLEG